MRLLAFARSLLARWDRRVISPQPLGLVFRQPPAARAMRRRHWSVTHTHLRRDVHVDLHPRIALTVVRPPGEAGAGTMRELVSTSSTVERAGANHELVLRNTSLLAAERVVERVVSRAKRVELLVRPAPPGRVAAPAERAGMPPSLVVQHALPQPASTPEPRPDGPPSGRPPAREPAAADVDLGRLTDHVVTAIDNRLAAHAERLGRG